MDDLLELDRKLDEQMLAFNIPDEVLERAANTERQAGHLGILHSPVALLRMATVDTLKSRQRQPR